MVQSQLSAYSGSDPIWGFVALVRSELFTGEAAVGLDPRVRLFAVEGHIYFAEREDDAPVGTRLVNCGAISANQLARGAVQAGGHESLARLFQRDATIDRDAVELTIAASTESLLASIANNAVGMPEVFPLRYHSTGMHHWLLGPLPTVAAEDEVAVAESHLEVPVAVEAVADEAAAEVTAVELTSVEDVSTAAATMPELAPQPLPDPVLATYPAPKAHPEPTTPEWPRADDEPAWEVPADARELAPLVALPAMSETSPAEVPALAMSPLPITAAELPQLASLTSIQIPPTAPNLFQPTAVPNTISPMAPAPAEIDSALPKLAAHPMSISELKKDLKNAAAASEPWTSNAKNMAAVQIWEMVDDMFDDGKKPDPRMGNGAAQVRTRGWLRKKG